MFLRRRRPIATAAVIGGTAYAANKAGQAKAEAQQAEAEQNARLEQLEAQQQAAQQPPAAAPAASDDPMVAKLKELASLRDQGILSDEEFAAAKQKLLAG